MYYCDTLLYAAYIVTQDSERTVFENASLAIDKGQVVAIGPRISMEQDWQADSVLDFSSMLVVPSCINAHSHGTMTYLSGLADDLSPMEWLTDHIFPVEQHLTPEIVEWSTLLSHAEMLRTGTTTCMDTYIIKDAAFRAACRSGIRCIGGKALYTFPSAGSSGPDATLDIIRRHVEEYRDHDRINVMVCPHSVYITTPDLLQSSHDLAMELCIPLHLHLAESSTETIKCLEMWGKRPIPYCYDLGLLCEKTTLAHVVDTDEIDLNMLVNSGVLVVHSPSSNMKLASGVAAIPCMKALGIPVALVLMVQPVITV